MCWFIEVTVIPQKPTLASRITVPPLPGPERLHGADLSYAYHEHHCACETVRRKRFAGLAAAVRGFCAQQAVKRVEVRQYWASDRGQAPREVALTQAEFVALCSAAGLAEDAKYRVSPDRYHPGGGAST